MTQKEYEKKIDAITKCGANRGPHDYIPVVWKYHNEKEFKTVETFMCRVCMCRVMKETLVDHFPLITF